MTTPNDEHLDDARHRAYVNGLTNRMVLTGEDLERNFREIIALRYPPSLFTPFMHEICHHTTFHTPFWTAMSFVLSEAERGLLTMGTSRKVESMHADTYFFGSLVQHGLNPLLEGMACFAEFDLLPGDSQTISQPSSVLSWLVLLRHLNDQTGRPHVLLDDQGRMARDALKQARLCETHAARRASFFASGYDPLGAPHLFGYVFFKAFWLTARQHTPAFADPELFLVYVLDFLFADDIATTHALNAKRRASARAQGVLGRVAARLKAIATTDQSAGAERLDKRGHKDRERTKIDQKLERMITARLDSARTAWSRPDDHAKLLRRQARQLAFRDYLTLGAMRVTIVPGAHREVVARNALGLEVCRATLFSNEVLTDTGPGWAEVIFAPHREPPLMALILSIDKHGPIAASMLTHNEGDAGLEQAFAAFSGCVSGFEYEADQVFRLSQSTSINCLKFNERSRATTRLMEWMTRTYCGYSDLTSATPTIWDWRIRLGAKDGFAQVLDPDTLQTWAAIGMADGSDSDQKWLSAFLGPDADQRARNAADVLAEKLGIDLVAGPPWTSMI